MTTELKVGQEDRINSEGTLSSAKTTAQSIRETQRLLRLHSLLALERGPKSTVISLLLLDYKDVKEMMCCSGLRPLLQKYVNRTWEHKIDHCLFSKITGYPVALWGGIGKQNLEIIKKKRATTHEVIFAKHKLGQRKLGIPHELYTSDRLSPTMLITEETKAALALLSYISALIRFNSCQCQP